MWRGRPFRFGVVANPEGSAAQWPALARRVAELGYSTLLMPDGLQLLAPIASLAVAAAAAPVRVGTFVLAAPLRPPRLAAWEAHSLTVLTDGRFELGIGTGRPAAREFAAQLGMPWGTADERLAQVADTITLLRELDGDRPTPVLVAAGGPKARALAASTADIVTLAAGPLASREEVTATAADLRKRAGDRAHDIELAMNLSVVGEQVPSWMAKFLGVDPAELAAVDSLTMLRGTVPEMADELQRRRDAFDVSYISVNAAFVEQFAPVVERLTGR